jgi:hypothetical protein
VVRLRTTRALRVARVALAREDDRVLAEHQMQEVPLVRLARKGSIGDRFIVAGAGAYASGLGPRGQLLGSVGLEWENEHWVPGLEVAVAAGTERHRGLETRDLLAQTSAQLLYTLRFGTSALRGGPVLGLAYLRQQATGHPDASSVGLSVGARLRADVQLTQSVGVYILADGRALGVKLATSRGARPGVKPFGAAAAGLRAAF